MSVQTSVPDPVRIPYNGPPGSWSRDSFRRAFLLVLLIIVSVLFWAMVQGFLLTLFLAAVFSGLAYPLYVRVCRAFNGRAAFASITTVLLSFVIVAGPLLTVAGVVTNQAVQVTQNVQPWLKSVASEPTALNSYFDRIPGIEYVQPYRDELLNRAGDVVGGLGTFLFQSLSATTKSTVVFVFNLLIMLYSMFFFLKDGPALLRSSLSYLPLRDDDKAQVIDRFLSVARATLKGTVLIGILQGSLAGFAFWLVGIEGAVFWATIMIVLSIIPGIGGAIVWVPAVIILLVTGRVSAALFLALFCGLVVGTIDNVLRPRLVGRDTKMHDLMIFISTLGGIGFFGPVGFIVGPILAALFLTVWEIFGSAYRDVLSQPSPIDLAEGANQREAVNFVEPPHAP